MNIRSKLTLLFTVIVATILTAFSVAVYSLSEDYRREEFFTRLENRGITTARLLVSVKEVDQNLMRIIDKNSIYALFHEKVLIFDERDSLIYSSLDDLEPGYTPELLQEIRKKRNIEYSVGDIEHVGLLYTTEKGDYVILSSAFDRYGRSKLRNLRNVLVVGLLVGSMLIIVSGYVFAGQTLQPLAKINEEISQVGENNLHFRLDEGNGRDEIAQLSKNFNNMLKRLELAFEMQQQFVSSASHELRNPLAAITGQLQMVLEKKRQTEEYERALRSLLEDTQTLVALTNGLLLLAQSNVQKQRLLFTQIRVDELLFAAQKELSKSQPNYHFQFEYGTFPDDEAAFSIHANEHLLKTAFINLMDNACKFSPDQLVQVRVDADTNFVQISFTNSGPGIPPDEQAMIFTPFYRGRYSTSNVPGYGIGLALCKRIVQLHQGNIELYSEKNKGTHFTAKLPKK